MPPAVDAPLPRRLLTPDNLVRIAVVGLAAFLRLFLLDQRPPHFDEGVNGWFTDQMQVNGFYHYDPHNYHGPLHFYVLFLFKILFGRNLWALRLPVALVGILTVDSLFRFRAFFGRRVCTLAALAMALSPGLTFFQRDAIHETWLVFFLVLAFWGLCGLWQFGEKRHLWALALGITGAVLTKETYLIHFGCFGVALVVLWLLEENLPSRRALLAEFAPPPQEPGGHTLWNPDVHQPKFLEPLLANWAPQRYRPAAVLVVAAVCLGLILFFYSGNFLQWSDLNGLVSTFDAWGHKATDRPEGHSKDFIYWTELILLNEPVAALGLFACLRYVVPPLPTARFRWPGVALLVLCAGALLFEFWPGKPFFQGWRAPEIVDPHLENAYKLKFTVAVLLLMSGAVACLALPRPGDWRMRLLAIYAGGTVLAYSLIPYKTPWCAISFIWPFFFTAAAVAVELLDRCRPPAPRAATALATGASLALSAWWMVGLNYVRPTEEHYSCAAATLMLDLKVARPVEDNSSYVYVQTYNDMWRVTEPLLNLTADDPSQLHLLGVILCPSTYPLPWVLGDFTGIGYFGDGSSPREYRADFLLVEPRRRAEAESHLDEEYFRESVHLRPAQDPLTLYLRASLFSHYFPNREPEFHPAANATPVDPPPPDADEPEPSPEP